MSHRSVKVTHSGERRSCKLPDAPLKPAEDEDQISEVRITGVGEANATPKPGQERPTSSANAGRLNSTEEEFRDLNNHSESETESDVSEEATETEIGVIPNAIGEMDQVEMQQKDLRKVDFQTLPLSPNLTTIKLIECDVTSSMVNKLFYRLEHFETLTCLNLSGTKLEAVAFYNAALPLSLKEFNLRKCHISKLKFNNLAMLNKLEAIDFGYNDLSTCAFNEKSFPKSMRRLNLECCNLGPAAGFPTRDLLKQISKLDRLVDLDLSRNDLSPHSNTFLNYMPTSVETVTLEHTRIKLTEITKMAEIRTELQRLVNLKSLSFPNPPKRRIREKFSSILAETGYKHQDYNVAT